MVNVNDYVDDYAHNDGHIGSMLLQCGRGERMQVEGFNQLPTARHRPYMNERANFS